MLILAFDTSQQATRVALWRDGQVLGRADELSNRGQAERLMPMVESVMTETKTEFGALDRIAVTCGPGSFTGVRIGIAAARGLALALGRPAVGIASTVALAAAVGEDERRDADAILAVIDSQRGDVFAQLFDHGGHDQGPVANIGYDAVAAMIGDRRAVVVGDAADAVVTILKSASRSQATSICDPAVVARLAATRPIDPAGPSPVYARAPDVTLGPGNRALRT